jgi:hypothetical protein
LIEAEFLMRPIAVSSLVLAIVSMIALAVPAPTEPKPSPDALPKDWSTDDIAKAAHPSAVPGATHVLAWKCTQDDRPLLVEECLVLCHLGENNWQLVSLYRHPNNKDEGQWQESMIHFGPSKDDPTGHDEWHREKYAKRPSNKDVYDFMDKFKWHLGADEGWKLLGGAVCKTTWQAVLKEKPTRDFGK